MSDAGEPLTGYYQGRYREEALKGKYHEWIIGSFIEEADARKTQAVEVKYWEFPVGPTRHPPKVSNTFACTLVLEGRVRGYVDATQIHLSAGDYIAISPLVPNNLVEMVLEPVKGLTIKAPSDPAAKRIIEGTGSQEGGEK